MTGKPFRFVDLFCGGGGSITGEVNALKKAGIRYDGRGFNHWDLAIQTIRANHPEIVPNYERACADVAEISGRPWSVFDEDPERLDLLWASPSCTHHSNAAGGKPKSEQLRSQPEHLLPFLRLTRCRRMFVENVPELLKWGPILDKDTVYKGKVYKAGQADPRKRGVLFRDWIRSVRCSGYEVDWQLLNAADYGAATSRTRLIIQAVRKSSGEKIIWPEPTHAKDPGLFGYKPWRSAAEIIDWSIPGRSIFDRPDPLCPNTMRRIAAGIRKYWGAWAEPFLIVMRGTSESQIPSTAVPLSAPLPTITAGGGHIALVEPIFVDQSHPADTADPARCKVGPLGTVTTRNNWSVCTPFLSRYNGGENRNHPTADPVPTIDCSNRYGIVSPLMIPQQSAGTVKPCAGNPAPTIATSGAIGVVTPLLMEYYGNGISVPVTEPVRTIPTKDRFALIEGRILTLPDGSRYKLDITHRMLTVRELAAATGFPPDYIFCGKDEDAKKMIGNAVCPDLAEALIRAVLAA